LRSSPDCSGADRGAHRRHARPGVPRLRGADPLDVSAGAFAALGAAARAEIEAMIHSAPSAAATPSHVFHSRWRITRCHANRTGGPASAGGGAADHGFGNSGPTRAA